MTGQPPRILITRPREDAEALAAELVRRGFPVMIQPMLEIRMLEGPPLDLEGVQALLCTSANGVRATAARTTVGTCPFWPSATPRLAPRAMKASYRSKALSGDVESLARLVKARLDPAAGRLFHAAGSAVAGDLAGDLAGAGFQVERHVLYAAEPVTEL